MKSLGINYKVFFKTEHLPRKLYVIYNKIMRIWPIERFLFLYYMYMVCL